MAQKIRKYQIVRMRVNETRWTFYAHGAAFDAANAQEIQADLQRRGERVRLLLTKESV